MIRFVRMTPELFDFLPVRPEFDMRGVADLPAAREVVCAAPNVAVAMLDGGKVIGAGGLVQVWLGRGYAWFLPGTWMEKRHFGWAMARCRIELDRAQSAGMWRVECTTLAGSARNFRFAERLGFAWEARMRFFGPDGKDHDLLARLPATHSERRSLAERVMEAA